MERNGASRAGRGASIALWSLRIGALAATWLVLTDSRNVQELILGFAVVVVVALGVALIARPRPLDAWARMRTGIRLAPAILTALGRLGRESVLLCWLAVKAVVTRRPIQGRFRAAPYRPGARREGVGGLIATELIGSLAPNRYVVGVDEEGGLVMIHELAPSAEPVDPLGR
jgi:hypothetical protein